MRLIAIYLMFCFYALEFIGSTYTNIHIHQIKTTLHDYLYSEYEYYLITTVDVKGLYGK